MLGEALKVGKALRKTFPGHLFKVAARCVALRHFEFRKRVRNMFDLDVAAGGDVESPSERVRNFAEDLGHLLSGFEIELVCGELHAMRIAHGLAGLNAEQELLGVGILVMQVVTIVGGDEGNARFLGEAEQIPVDTYLDGQALVLDFEEEVALAEDVAEAVGIFAGLVEFFFDHAFGHGTTQTGGKGDEPFAVLAEEFIVDAGLVVEAFQETSGDEFDQIAVAFEGFAEKNEVIGATSAGLEVVAVLGDGPGLLSPFEAAALGNVDFTADDRLDVALGGLIEEIGSGKEVAMVGDGHSGHFLPGGFVEKFGSFARAVKKTVIGVNVQVNELRVSHGVSL